MRASSQKKAHVLSKRHMHCQKAHAWWPSWYGHIWNENISCCIPINVFYFTQKRMVQPETKIGSPFFNFGFACFCLQIMRPKPFHGFLIVNWIGSIGTSGRCRHTVASPRFISEWRWWLRSASTSSCLVSARGRAMLFRIWRLSDSLLALAVTISTSKPFLDLKCMKCKKTWKWRKHFAQSPLWMLKHLILSELWMHSQANVHPTNPLLLWSTETKLSRIKICLGNFASRCDLAKKPKNGISCCSLSDRPSVMTWAVVPSSSVAARSNNKALPAFP